MALQKQTVQMSVVDGIDTKTDEKNIVATKWTVANNVVYTKTGAASKRFGYDRLTKNVLNSTPITAANALTTFKDELLEYSANKLYTFSEAQDKLVDKGSVQFAASKTSAINNTNYRLVNPSFAIIDNLACYAYEEITGTTNVRYSIIDNVTGTTIYSASFTSESAPRVQAILGKFYIFTVVAGTLKFRTVNFGTPTAITATTNVSTLPGFVYDVQTIGLRVYYIVPGAVTGCNIGYIDINSAVSGPNTLADAALINRVNVNEESTGLVRFCYGSTLADPKTVLYNNALSVQLHAPATISTSSVQWDYITSVKTADNPDVSAVYVSIKSNTLTSQLSRCTVGLSGTPTALSVIFYGVVLGSKVVVLNGKEYFIVVRLLSNAIDTLYLMSQDGSIIAKWDPDQISIVTQNNLRDLLVLDQTLSTAAPVVSEFQLATQSLRVPTTIKKLTADFTAINNYFDSELGDNLHIAGGILKMYDGNRVVEHGFLEIPGALVLNSESSSGSGLPDGSYQYVLVYAWKDKYGQLHRSAPSTPFTYVVTGGPKIPVIRYAFLHLTEKNDVELEVYRTEVNGTNFYKHKSTVSDIIINNKSGITGTFSDTMQDSTLINGEVLYTTGGVLDNIAAISSKHITTYKTRIVLMSADGTAVQYSKLREQRGPVEFNDALRIELDNRGGPGTAVAVMDDHWVIFKESAIFAVSGEGPNNLGEQDDFRLPQLISSDVGCVDLNSISSTSAGIFFKSAKGIYLLKRDFGLQYIGDMVEGYNSNVVTSATLLAKTNQVRFTLDSQYALVYDYYHNRWSTFDNINAIDATIYNDKYTYVRANADLMTESSAYTDAGSFISMTLASAWISLAGIQGFERFYKMLILGTYKNGCKFKVSFAYDFDGAFTSEVIVDAGGILETPIYGEGIYGETGPYGGNDPLFQWRIFPKRQKCESFRFKIEDINSGVPGESFSLSNFAAEIGLKPPAYKKARANGAAAK